jgi:RecB family exonuclease
LRSLEREVSDQRRELHGVIDRIDRSLAAQLR